MAVRKKITAVIRLATAAFEVTSFGVQRLAA